MKKFLSILLALAVGFTFTFGSAMSAFAVAPDTTAVSKAMSCVQNVNAVAKQTVAANGDVAYDGWKVKAANWDLAYEKAYDDAIAAVAGVSSVAGTLTNEYIEVLNAALSTTLTDSSTSADINAAIVNYLVAATTSTAAKPALLAQLAIEKDALKANVAAVKTDIYSTTEYTSATKPAGSYLWKKYSYVSGDALTAGDDCYKAVDVAESIKAGIVEYIDAVSIADADYASADAVKTAYTNAKTFVGTYVQLNGDANNNNIEDASETWTYTLKAIESENPLTKAVEESGAASDAASKAAGKATIASNIAAFKGEPAYLASAGDAKAAYDDYLAAYETAATYLVDNDNATPIEIEPIANESEQAALVSQVKNAKKAIDDAADLSKETNNDGSKTYDDKKLASNLKALLIGYYKGTRTDAYAAGTVATTPDNAKLSYLGTANKLSYKNLVADAVDETGEIPAIHFVVDDNGNVTAPKTSGDWTNTTEYYALEWSKITAAIDAYNTAIDAAVTETDIKKAGKALGKAINAVDDKTAVLGYYGATGKLNTTVTTEFGKLKAYANALYTAQGTTDPLVFDITDISRDTISTDGSEGTLVAFYIDKNARTKEEITALYNDAKAILDGAKTTSALKAEAAAVVSQIAALPAKSAITVADKAAIEAAYKAYDALNDGFKVYVTNKTTLDTAISAVQKAEADAIFIAYKALPARSAITAADKDAVNAVHDAIEAYNDTEMYASDFDASTHAAVDGLVEKVRGLELDAVKAAVKAIPATKDITLADEATIKAARDAYDAFVKEYADTLTTEEVTALDAAEKTIAAAEATIAPIIEANKFDNDDAKAYVQDLAIAVRTVKSGKKVKVTVNADVQTLLDNGFTVEYKFYKSTKKSSGYKNTVNKTTNTYTNTNPVKGKNYYKVKLVVKNADGTVVATTPLTQCKYGVRTMK